MNLIVFLMNALIKLRVKATNLLRSVALCGVCPSRLVVPDLKPNSHVAFDFISHTSAHRLLGFVINIFNLLP